MQTVPNNLSSSRLYRVTIHDSMIPCILLIGRDSVYVTIVVPFPWKYPLVDFKLPIQALVGGEVLIGNYKCWPGS
jgi:hypothetical protein